MKRGCVIGFGAIAPSHIAGLRLAEYGALAGICDPDPSKKEQIEREGVHYFSSFEQVLEDDGIDVVHICTPHYLHAPMTKAALLAGKAVVLEKPAAVSRKETEELVAFAEENGYGEKVTVMFQNRYNSCIKKLRELMNGDDSLGALREISGQVNWHRDEAYYASAPWRGTWEMEGGGFLINQAIHTVDLMLLFGGRAKKIVGSASRRIVSNIEVEDTADALILFENGARGTFFGTNGCAVTSQPMLELVFENVRFRYADQVLYRIVGQESSVICRDDSTFRGKSCWGNGHAMVIDDFYRHLEGKGGAVIPLREAIPAMDFVFEIYRQAFGRE